MSVHPSTGVVAIRGNLTPEYLSSLREGAEHMRDHNLVLQDVRGEVTLALLDAINEARERVEKLESHVRSEVIIVRRKYEIARRLRVAQERKDAGQPNAPICVCVCHSTGEPMTGYQCVQCGCTSPENDFTGDIGGPLP
jgi:hypothetical protein